MTPGDSAGGHVVRGLRQALLLLCVCLLVASAAAGIWWAVQDGAFRVKLGIVLLVVAGLMALTGNNALNRSGTAEIRALMGSGPDHEDPSTGGALTGVGIFLFVSLPLFVLGGVLYGSG
jgi:hypothetical protein